jgi:hypothetical protein
MKVCVCVLFFISKIMSCLNAHVRIRLSIFTRFHWYFTCALDSAVASLLFMFFELHINKELMKLNLYLTHLRCKN